MEKKKESSMFFQIRNCWPLDYACMLASLYHAEVRFFDENTQKIWFATENLVGLVE
uniref:Uncharacterized protein n=1 Tax=viral metagenome TaxID=1070528 RepID=A0A6M3LM42_9ZZZZ